MSNSCVLSGVTVGAVVTVGTVREMGREKAGDPGVEAESVAVWAEAVAPVLMVNVAEVALASTVTEAGTVRAAALLFRVTATPPAGAAGEIVTVQDVLAF
ncbi:MAG TPA: hypothetical protein VLY24_06000 [Bryobacteraceae bacterium]|nr:hypothetical protein [Bryobacteraceae bacterium]